MNKSKLFSLLLVVSQTAAQTILSVLGVQTDLSMLNSFIDSSPQISRLLSTANNFTFLAPSNTAINAWLAAPGTTSLTTDEVEALISYHLLHGTFPVASFTGVPLFANSNLNNVTFENITGGQAVELLQTPSGPSILSGNATISTISKAVSPPPVNPFRRATRTKYV
jgi:Fasciclin domain